MLDIRRIRTEPDAVRAELARKDDSLGPALDEVVDLDAAQRRLVAERDELRARIRAVSNEVGQLFREQRKEEAGELQAESRMLGEQEKELDSRYEELSVQLRDRLLRIPNVPHPEAPDGATDADNPVIRVVGRGGAGFSEAAYEDHQRVPHWETGEALGILDVARAVKISGSMFTMLRGPGATMSRALCQLALDMNADAFEEVRPPSLVTSETLTATGQLPKFADDAYHIERDDLWCIPTAEVPLTSLGRDEILAEDELPRRMMAYTPCYRREAGSAGRDTRGLLRAHEFDKVEILAYTTPEQAPVMLEELLGRAEALQQALGLSYRVIEICTGDLGQSHHRSFDIEVWAPGVGAWLEVSSVSWFSDYQARRGNLRYKPTGGKGTEFLHTLNGSALAVPRVWAAIVETYRQSDGSVLVPEALRPYMRGMERIAAG